MESGLGYVECASSRIDSRQPHRGIRASDENDPVALAQFVSWAGLVCTPSITMETVVSKYGY